MSATLWIEAELEQSIDLGHTVAVCSSFQEMMQLAAPAWLEEFPVLASVCQKVEDQEAATDDWLAAVRREAVDFAEMAGTLLSDDASELLRRLAVAGIERVENANPEGCNQWTGAGCSASKEKLTKVAKKAFSKSSKTKGGGDSGTGTIRSKMAKQYAEQAVDELEREALTYAAENHELARDIHRKAAKHEEGLRTVESLKNAHSHREAAKLHDAASYELRRLTNTKDSTPDDAEEELIDNANPEGCNQYTGPGCRGHKRHDSIHHDLAIDKVAGNLLSAKHLTEAQRKTYHAALSDVIRRMPEKAAKAVYEGVKKTEWFADMESLTAAYVKGERDEGRWPDPTGKVNGTFNMHTGLLRLNGETPKTNAPGLGIKKGETKRDIAGTYAHELTHALDVDQGHSKSKSWQAAYQIDVLKGSMTNPSLTRYARSSPVEAFAEFGRALYASDVSHDELQAKFPMCFKYFQSQGFIE